jgi:hypothetical protein
MNDASPINTFSFDETLFARNAARLTGGSVVRLGGGGDPLDTELPNTDSFKDGDILIHYTGIYAKWNNQWVTIVNNDRTACYIQDWPKIKPEHQETDTKPWLDLLEE